MFNLVTDYIKKLGYTDSDVNDRVMAFLRDQTGLDTTITDMSMNFLTLENFRTGTINDRFYKWLLTKTLNTSTRSVNDLARSLDTTFPGDNLICNMPLRSNLDLVVGTGVATFTRSTTGTLIDRYDGLIKTAAINVPRFEQNGVLIEGAIETLLIRNEEFNSVAWTKSELTILENNENAPDGTVTMDLAVPTATNAGHALFQNANIISGVTYTQAVFAKAGDYDFLQMAGSTAFDITNAWANFNLNTGEIGAVGSIGVASIESLGGGIYKCMFTLTATSSSASGRILCNVLEADTASRLPAFVGDTVSGVNIWGGGLVLLPFASSYIPTISSTVTRDADDLSIDEANIPAPTADYTVSFKTTLIGLDSTLSQVLFNVDGETSRRIEWNTTTGAIEAIHGAVTSTSTTIFSAGDTVEISFTVGTTNQTLYIDGIQEDQDTKGTVTGTATAIDIGHQGGANQAFSSIQDLHIFDSELTPAQIPTQ